MPFVEHVNYFLFDDPGAGVYKGCGTATFSAGFTREMIFAPNRDRIFGVLFLVPGVSLQLRICCGRDLRAISF